MGAPSHPALGFVAGVSVAPLAVVTLAASAVALGFAAWLRAVTPAQAAAVAAALVGLVLALLLRDATVLAAVVVAAAVIAAGDLRGLEVRVHMQHRVLGALLIAVGFLLLRSTAAAWVTRAGAVVEVLGAVLALGLAPYLEEPASGEGEPTPAQTWLGLLAPLLFVAWVLAVIRQLHPDDGAIFATVLVSVGLVNLAIGVIGAWRTADEVRRWQYSFVCDWGLVFVGTGLLLPRAFSAAYLVLLSMLVCRLPLYLSTRAQLSATEDGSARRGTARSGLLATAALSGAAPFAGFAARLLLLQAAASLSWILAAVLAAGMLLWLLHSIPLARTVSFVSRSQRRVAALALAMSAALGLYPAVFLAASRLS